MNLKIVLTDSIKLFFWITFIFPIELGEQGPNQSLYSGNNQYPFYCMSLNSSLGQPEIDNHEGFGVPIYQSIA